MCLIPTRTKKGVASPGTEDIESCEKYVLGIEPRSSLRAVSVISDRPITEYYLTFK